MMLEELLQALDSRQKRVFEVHSALTAFKAVGPDNGGPGEMAKAKWLARLLQNAGIHDIEYVNAKDDRVAGGERPNLIVRIPGKTPRMLWILGHLDVVPPGEMDLWTSDPWQVTYDETDTDLLRGRGVEDNQQAIVAGMVLALELAELGITPDFGLGLIFVADEETGNKYGVSYLLAQKPNLISQDDLVLVPDFGSADGTLVEVAEKGVLWVKITLTGKQCHASTPDEGVNALIAASDMILRISDVERAFPIKNELFEPQRTTLTPTRHDANVPNINTMPGQDVFFVDCRVLPEYSLEQVFEALVALGVTIKEKYGVEVEFERINIEPSSMPTRVDSEVVQKLMCAVKSIYGVDCRAHGVGASTVACWIRKKGISAAVWSRVIPNYHMPNEATRISNNIGDAKVFASMLFACMPCAL